MTARYILALDQGTTSSRAIVFDEAFAVAGLAQRELRQHFPEPGWVEHDPLEIWETQIEVAAGALARAGVAASNVAAIGITNQRETTVVWDRATGHPIHRAIVWQDRRTAPLIERLKADGLEPRFRERTGLVLDPYFSGTKLRWILDHVPDAQARAERGELAFGTIDSWLVWKLTGGARHVTDPSNASRTLLFNIHTTDWDDTLLGALDIPRALLPEIVPSSGLIAPATASGVDGIPIAGIAGDQQAALFGQACFDKGMAKNTYGTGCFLLMNTGDHPAVSANQLITTVAWQRDNRTTYALEGSVFMAGAVVQWLRDGLGIVRTAADTAQLAASVPDTGGVYLVPAFAGLGAPHWDPYARGSISGLTRGTTAAHLVRAALESIAFQSADVLEAMNRDAGIALAELRVDGGASANDLLMQFQADLLGVPVVRAGITETTALGAACLAGLAMGVWDEPAIRQNWKAGARFEPCMSREEVAQRRHGWQRAIERARNWIE
jgi:glycerol kinase